MKNETTTNTVETTTTTIDTPKVADVQVQTKDALKGKKMNDAEKIKTLETIAKKSGNEVTVTIAPKMKKSAVKKDAPKKAEPKAESKKSVSKAKGETKDVPKPTAEPSKVDLSKVAPLTVPKELLDAKLSALDKKLAKEKRETTTNPYHIAYGFFVAKTKAGNIVTLEYHENLKPTRWIARNDKGKVLGEPAKTMHGLHQIAVNQF